MRHVRCLARSCRAKCEPWMFWLHFRQISVAVQLGTFFLARAIRAKMLHTARKRRAERSSKDQAADTWLPAPEERSCYDDTKPLLQCPERYRNSWFYYVRGHEHAQFLRERMGEAFLILTRASASAASQPDVSSVIRVNCARAAREAEQSAAAAATAAANATSAASTAATSSLSPGAEPQAVQQQNQTQLRGQDGSVAACVMRKVRRESRRRRSVSKPRMANLIGITSRVTRVLLALGPFEAHSAAACYFRSRSVVSHALASTSKCYVDRVERLVGALR